MDKKTEHTGPWIRVVKLAHDDWCYIVRKEDFADLSHEIQDYGGDDELEYRITFKSMPVNEFNALPEFNE